MFPEVNVYKIIYAFVLTFVESLYTEVGLHLKVKA